MKRNSPFAQAKMMMAAIASIMANNPSHMHPGLIGALGPYKSRGKGRGTPPTVFYRSRSKYQPHYGYKESNKLVARVAAGR